MMKFKYLFEAHFKDGESVKQTDEDVSELDETKSAFFDVLDRGLSNLERFRLVDAERSFTSALSLDFPSGKFTIGSRSFYLSEIDDGNYTQPELVFCRRHEVDVMDGKETKHTVKYVVGWKAIHRVTKQEIKRTIILE